MLCVVYFVAHYQWRSYKDAKAHVGTHDLNKHILTFYFKNFTLKQYISHWNICLYLGFIISSIIKKSHWRFEDITSPRVTTTYMSVFDNAGTGKDSCFL
jgi:hypothetical protein